MTDSTTTLEELRKELEVGTPRELSKYLNILIYGDSGVGKTYLAGSAADEKSTHPIFYFDIEGGTTSIRKKDVDIPPLERKNLYKNITLLLDRFAMLGEDLPYKTMVFDSFSEFQKIDMENIMKFVSDAHSDRDEDVPSQREWGKSQNRVRRIVRQLRDLPCNTILTCLSTDKQFPDGSMKTLPQLPGKLAADIPGFVDVVGYMYVSMEDGEVQRRILFQPTERYIAKDRTGTLPQIAENVSFPDLWKLMQA